MRRTGSRHRARRRLRMSPKLPIFWVHQTTANYAPPTRRGRHSLAIDI